MSWAPALLVLVAAVSAAACHAQRTGLESAQPTATEAGTTISPAGDSRSGNGSATLFVRDETRDAVVMFLAPDGPPDAVLRVASLIYHR